MSVLWLASESCFGQQYTINVTAGEFDRLHTLVSFSFPEKVLPGVYKMEDESGNMVCLQVDEHNKGWFILDELKAKTTRKYKMSGKRITKSSSKSNVDYTYDENKISFTRQDHTVLSYFLKANNPPDMLSAVYERAGYIHPVYSPNGIKLTNHLDTRMHPHHYGIWSAWPRTEFQGRNPDFWNVQDSTGRVHHSDSTETIWKGPVQGGFKANNYFMDLSGRDSIVALTETWKVRVYNTGTSHYNIFDLTVTQTANSGQPLTLPQYRYGGVAIRGSGKWNNPDSVSFVTSEGYDRGDGNNTQARWVHMGGSVVGKMAGIAVLDHPKNFRFPQPVRIHPEIPYFVYAPVMKGAMTIESGTPYTARYRYVTYDGFPDPEMLNRLWNDYAYPPGVTVIPHKE